MAIDRNGTLYLFDSGSGDLLSYSPDGKLINDWAWEKLGFNLLTPVHDLVIGPDGNLYCSSSINSNVFILSTNGTLVDKVTLPLSTISLPSLAFTPDGDIIAGNSETKKITIIHRTKVEGRSLPSASSVCVRVQLNVSSEEESNSSCQNAKPVIIPVQGLKYPTQVVYGDDKTLFISDYNAHTVYKTNLNGKILLTINNQSVPDGRFNNPGGIVRDSAGTIYIANQGYGRIEIFSPDGKFLSSLGSHGNKPGQFKRPSGLAFGPDGSLYVADLGNNRIVRLDISGKILTIWGKEGIRDGEFSEPWGIAVDSTGMVYVTDSQNNRIQQFNSNGTWIRSWGSKGDTPGKFQIPLGIQIGYDGFLYVVDVNNYRIQKFYPNGTFIQGIYPVNSVGSSKVRMNGLSLSSAGEIYSTNINPGTIIKLELVKEKGQDQSDNRHRTESSKSLLFSLFSNILEFSIELNELFQSDDTDLGVSLMDLFNDSKPSVLPEQKWLTLSSSRALPSSEPNDLSLPGGISLGPDKSIYIADYGNHRIRKFSLDGVLLGSWGFKGSEPGAFFNPSDVAVDRFGYVYVTDTNNHRIQKFTADGQYIQQWNLSIQGESRLARPTSIAVDEEGYIYVTDYANNKILKYSSDGIEICRWGEYGNVGGHLVGPYGITVRNGLVYVTDFLSSGIKVYDKTGNFISSWGVYGTGEGSLIEPEGISMDSDGNILVADRGNNRIQIFNLQGKVLSNDTLSNIPELKYPGDLLSLADNKILVSDTGNNRIVILEYRLFNPDDLSLDERYARFSQSIDDWWNMTWEKINQV